MCSTYFHFG